MDKSTSTGLDYSKGRIGGLFRKIFIPTLLGMVFIALITVIDGVFVGQGVGPDGIAAVNIIAPLYMVTTGIGLMFGIGSSVICGMALASDDTGRANSIMTQAYLSATIIMIIGVATVLLIPGKIAQLLGSSEHLMPLAVDYLCWLIPACVFLAWSSIGMMVIRLDGSPKYAMLINIIPAVLNIIGDYILIFPCGMGVKGAAIATAASVAVGGIMAVVYFRYSYILKFIFKADDFFKNMLHVIAIGSSAFVTEIAMSVMMLTGNYIFMKYSGDAGVAAYSIACYLFPIIFMMSNAVAQSAQPIISYNHGSGNEDRVRKAFVLSVKVAIGCGLLVTTGVASGADSIIALFIPLDSEAGALASKGLPWFAICAVFFSVNIAFIGYCQAIGLAARAMVYTLLRGIIFLVPLFFILSEWIPSIGMWCAIPASELLTLAVILFVQYRLKRE